MYTSVQNNQISSFSNFEIIGKSYSKQMEKGLPHNTNCQVLKDFVHQDRKVVFYNPEVHKIEFFKDFEVSVTKIEPLKNTPIGTIHKVSLLRLIMRAVQKEISYRFLFEKVILPCISPQFAVFSTARTIMSTLFFTARVGNQFLNRPFALQNFKTAVLGVICSVAQERFGLIAAIAIHITENLRQWKDTHNASFSDLFQNLWAIRFREVIEESDVFIIGFFWDAISPFTLICELASKFIYIPYNFNTVNFYRGVALHRQ